MKEIKRRWFSMKADESAAEISIFDEIGLWGIGVSDFKKELDAVKDAKSIKLLLNSPGGDVFAGMAIYNLLDPMREKIDVEVLGLAASISSIIALAGKSLKMDSGSYLMIHDPWAIGAGTATDFRKTADLLDQIGGTMADIYTPRSNHTRGEILALMADETWMTAQEAVDHGFADETVEVEQIAALACDVSRFGYQHMPDGISAKRDRKPPANLRELEATLRDAGFSKNDALRAVADIVSDFRARHPEENGSESEPPAATVPPKIVTFSPEKRRAQKARYRELVRAV
jgi:ATP-dependent Clp endopeptidase proteolytic subunit ClpP